MHLIVSLSLSLLVIVAGMFLLAKTNKDALGKIYTFVSYAVITIGILLASAAFCGALCKMTGASCNYGKASHCAKGGYDQGGKCASYQSCAQSGSCSKASACGASSSCKSKCEAKKSCSKGSASCDKSGEKKCIKKTIKKTDDDNATVIEVEKED